MGIQEFRQNPDGTRYNPDWGYLNGKVYNRSYNYYHKPQFSLNHYWTIDSKSELSTSLYASYGNGGGRRDGGQSLGKIDNQYDYQSAFDANVAGTGEATSWVAASENRHQWYGLLSVYNRKVSSNLDIMAGLDLRQYAGKHYYKVTDLLGADYVVSDDNREGEDRRLNEGGKYNRNNIGYVGWQGVFLQAEYDLGKLSTFINTSLSNTSYSMKELMFTSDSLDNKSDSYNFFGYQVKGGANYNITTQHNVFANAGYFEKAPFFGGVFTSNTSISPATVNKDAPNEKILSFELGYGFKSRFFTANVNAYRTSWLDKSYSSSIQINSDDDNPQFGTANILGVDALHKGIELDFTFSPIDALQIQGMASFGDWEWTSNVDSTIVRDQNNEIVSGSTVEGLFIKGLKVGDAAQTTMALNVDYNITPELKLGTGYNYFANLYSAYQVTSRTSSSPDGDVVQPWKVPDYYTVDLRLVYKFDFEAFDVTFLGNVNNLLNTKYISNANETTAGGGPETVNVYYGIGRTWTTTLRINF